MQLLRILHFKAPEEELSKEYNCLISKCLLHTFSLCYTGCGEALLEKFVNDLVLLLLDCESCHS